MYNRILLPLDGSPLAEQAIPHAIEMTHRFGGVLHLVRVVLPFSILIPSAIEYDVNEDYRRYACQEAHQYLDHMVVKLQDQVTASINTKVIEGIVVDSILDYTKFHSIDLIVMATHGRSGLRRWMFGSVAERVLHDVPAPVLMIRARPELLTEEELSQAQVVEKDFWEKFTSI